MMAEIDTVMAVWEIDEYENTDQFTIRNKACGTHLTVTSQLQVELQRADDKTESGVFPLWNITNKNTEREQRKQFAFCYSCLNIVIYC